MRKRTRPISFRRLRQWWPERKIIEIAQYRAQFETALNDVQQLFLLRSVRRNLDAMIWSQPELFKSSLIYGYLNTTYSRTLAMGVRRQSEPGDSRSTIGSLLRRIAAHHTELTRERLDFKPISEVDTWRPYALNGTDVLDPTTVQALITKVETESVVARQWANKRVAHLDNQPVGATFGELERGLDVLGEAARWLFGLFNNGGYLAWLTPDPDKAWMKMFSKPWLDPNTFTEVFAHTLDNDAS